MNKVDFKSKKVVVVDNGAYVSFAANLSQYFGEVCYWMPWVNEFPESLEL